MMKYLIIFLIAFSVGCRTKTIEVNDTYVIDNCDSISIDFDKLQKSYPNFLEIDKFHCGGIVPLETNDSFLIGYIKRVDILDSCIYVFDKQSESIVSFFFNGKGKKTINKKGRSYNEYIFLYSYFIDKKRKIIFIVDSPRKAILKYDMDGNFLERIKIHNYIWYNLIVTQNGNFCFFSDDSEQKYIDTKLWLFDNKGVLISKYLPHRSFMEDVIPLRLSNFICHFNDTTYFVRRFDNYLYSFTDNGLSQRYYFNFMNNHRYEEKDILKYTPIKNPFTKLGLPSSIENLFITKTHIYFLALFNNKVYQCFYNKKTNQVTIANRYVLNGSNMILPSRVVGTYKDYFIFLTHPHQFKAQLNYLKTRGNKNKLNELEHLIKIDNSLDVEDNPILLLYKPKYF